MKKIALGLLLLLSFSGCSSNHSNSEISSSDNISHANSSSASNMESQEFDESDKLSRIIDLNSLETQVLTDSSEKRVILFTKDKQKMYKSVFVKSTRFLKVIDLQNNKVELFYGKI